MATQRLVKRVKVYQLSEQAIQDLISEADDANYKVWAAQHALTAYTAKRNAALRRLHEAGLSHAEIAAATGIPKTTSVNACAGPPPEPA